MRIQFTLSPTAAPIPPFALWKGFCALLGGGASAERLQSEIGREFGARHAFLLSSGKAALSMILSALARSSNKRKVVIPAYTCFSVPSAIVKAGLEISLCDVNPATLDFDHARLENVIDDQTLCVVPTHLFGMPADVNTVVKLCKPKGIAVVEDAAQSMGARSNGRWLGTIGDIGFFSLGRGKNLSSGHGGIIVTNSDKTAQALSDEYTKLPTDSWYGAVHNMIELAATGLFIKPSLYWLPAGLPLLGLGETRFYTDFPVQRMATAPIATLAEWRHRLETVTAIRQAQAARLIRQLQETAPDVRVVSAPDAVYLRLPIFVRDRRVKDSLTSLSAEQGLGISGCYPAAIHQIPQLQRHFRDHHYPGAMEIVSRLVTLPTHRFVRSADQRRICELIRKVSTTEDPSNVGRKNAVPSSHSIHVAT